MNDNSVETRKKTARDDMDFASSRLSETTRLVGLGLTTFVFALANSEVKFSKFVLAEYKWQVLLLALCGIAALACDVLQYLFGFKASQKASMNADGKYEASIWYSGRWFFFYTKMGATVCGAIGMLYVMTAAILRF